MGARFRSWWQKIKRPLSIIGVIAASILVIALIVGIIGGYLFNWKGTGVGQKTLWDWLQLLIIPTVLGGLAFFFNYLQKKIDDQRAKNQKDIENQRTIDQEQASVLNIYIDDMSKLLLEKNLRSSQVGDEVRTIAQTKTQTAFDRLNSERKVRILKFLYAARLLEKVDPLIDLSSGNYLEGLDLTNINLRGANLKEVNLSRTNLSYANLAEANLERATLTGANLSHTSLLKTNLYMARLTGAELYRTDFLASNLELAKLQGVDLTEAMGFEKLHARHADLRNADLHGLRLTNANLGKAYLEGANLESADLTGTEIYEGKLMGANLSNAILTETQLYDADLSEANLSGASLFEADLSGADLSETNLHDSNLHDSNLRKAKVTQEQLEDVKSLKGAIMPDGSIHP